jgi:hypothetical protein
MTLCAGRIQRLRRNELVTTLTELKAIIVEVEAEEQEEVHGERDPEYVNRSEAERMSTISAASTATDVPEETAMSTGGRSKRRLVVDARLRPKSVLLTDINANKGDTHHRYSTDLPLH